MTMTVRDLAKGPALGDAIERMSHQRRALWIVFGAAAVLFLLIGVFASRVALLLLAVILLVGVAMLIYSRREVHGHGRLAVHRGTRR
jgi:hypothetical protein